MEDTNDMGMERRAGIDWDAIAKVVGDMNAAHNARLQLFNRQPDFGVELKRTFLDQNVPDYSTRELFPLTEEQRAAIDEASCVPGMLQDMMRNKMAEEPDRRYFPEFPDSSEPPPKTPSDWKMRDPYVYEAILDYQAGTIQIVRTEDAEFEIIQPKQLPDATRGLPGIEQQDHQNEIVPHTGANDGNGGI